METWPGRLGAKEDAFCEIVRAIAPGEAVDIVKRQTIKAISTRKYYAGEQAVALLVNGREVARVGFELRIDG